MDQHPVPQNITGYQFRLVGSMTLKQFGMLATGVVIAILFYASPFPWFFKYPFVALFGLSGAAFAFLPINDIPLDRWVIAFFKSIYSPTQFHWQKEAIIPEFLLYQPNRPINNTPTPQPKSEPSKVSEYLRTIATSSTSDMDKTESALIGNFTQMLQNPSPTPSIYVEGTQPAPTIKKFRDDAILEALPTITMPSTPTTTPTQTQPATAPTVTPPPSPSISRGPSAISTNISGTTAQVPTGPTNSAQFSIPTSLLHAPESPNVIVGVVSTPSDKIIDNAIIEVKDADGHPVRALKTSRLGQFSIAAPLKNGRYTIEIEKEGLTFDTISFEAIGQIIQPIEIKSK